MSSFYHAVPQYNNAMPHNSHPHNNHGGRRRGPRGSSAQNSYRQHFVKQQRSSSKEIPQTNPVHDAYLRDFDAALGFEDDDVFCPFDLLTEDDVCAVGKYSLESSTNDSQLQSISSTASDRSSLSSGSPEASPLQHQVQPTPSFMLSTPSSYNQAAFHANAAQQHRMKLHQPLAQRNRNAIPIVDPTTRHVASPPLSVSPARQMQYGRRW